MLLAKINRLKKYYGDKLVLNIDNFEILDGDRIGLVGENGAGKTTLIKALLNLIEVDEGSIYLTKSYSYISQLDKFTENINVTKVKKVFNAPNSYSDFLSGGEKVKLKIAKALSENTSLIIADEPTSNLDKKSVEVLEEMLKSYSGSLLLVSHDREFLDKLCNIIVEIDNGMVKIYNGNYSKYIELKALEKETQLREYNNYATEKKRLENAILVKEKLGNSIKKTPKRMGNSEARLHRKMGGQKGKKKIDNAIKNINKRIEHLEVKEKPIEIKETKIRIKEGMELITKTPIEIKDLNLCVGNKVLFDNISIRIKRGKRIAIIGENGCGKSTLIKEIIRNSNECIKINGKVRIGYFDQEQNILNEDKSILENIKENSSFDEGFIRINLDGFGFKGHDVYKKISVLSGGEKVKVALCKIILSDNNVLILDEPTNYLDIKSMESLESALINTNKTLILVSHDRRFVEKVCNYLIFIEDRTIRVFDGTYEEFIENKNIKSLDKDKKRLEEERMLIENKIAETLSLLVVEKDEKRKNSLNKEYNNLINRLKYIKNI